MEIRLPAPDAGGPYITSGAAGLWLWGPADADRTWAGPFDELVERHASNWMQAVYLGREKRWRVEDVAVLAYLLRLLPTTPPGKPSKSDKTQEKKRNSAQARSDTVADQSGDGPDTEDG